MRKASRVYKSVMWFELDSKNSRVVPERRWTKTKTTKAPTREEKIGRHFYDFRPIEGWRTYPKNAY